MDELFVFTWTIENFNWCLTDVGESIDSPVFVADTPCQTHWKLVLFPKGFDGKHISCYLQCHEYNENLESVVDFEIGILYLNNVMHCASTLKNVRFSRRDAAGFKELASLDMLLRNEEESLPGGTLKIQCHLKASQPVGSFDEDLDLLSKTFKRMFEFGGYNDVVLQTEDLKFPAHKAVLGVRSIKYFREIEMNPGKNINAANQVYEIDAGEVKYDAFKHFLLYLYSGIIESTNPVVWCQLYEMAECYQLFDMKRDIFPTITSSAVRTKVLTKNKSVVFRIKNFSTTQSASMGRLVDLDFARVSVVFFSELENIGFLVCCYVSDTDCQDILFCSASVLDVHGVSHYTSVHEIPHDAARTSLFIHFPTPKIGLMNDSFLISDSVSVKFTFTVLSGFEPSKIGTEKVGRALCLGHEPPSKLTLNRLSKDLESLVEWNEVESNVSDWMKPESAIFQKAVLCAWSAEREKAVKLIQTSSSSSIFRTEIEKLVYRFLCTGRITIPTIEMALGAYTAASKFKIDRLKYICKRTLESKLSLDNAIDSLRLARTHECFECVAYFVCNHFDQISIKDEWRNFAFLYPFVKDTIYCWLRNLNSERQMLNSNL